MAMDEQRAKEIAQEIWDELPRDSGVARLDYDPDHGYMLSGNREGLLRFAAEVLHAASDAFAVSDPSYLAPPGSEPVWRISQSDEVPPKDQPPMPGWKQKAIGMSVFGVLLFGVLCAIIGFVTVVRYLLR